MALAAPTPHIRCLPFVLLFQQRVSLPREIRNKGNSRKTETKQKTKQKNSKRRPNNNNLIIKIARGKKWFECHSCARHIHGLDICQMLLIEKFSTLNSLGMKMHKQADHCNFLLFFTTSATWEAQSLSIFKYFQFLLKGPQVTFCTISCELSYRC